MIHRSERADELVEVLGAILAEPLGDPVQAEVVAVPTRGVERWIAQRLSHRLGSTSGGEGGVCANVRFPSPGSLIHEVIASARGFDPDTDPWRPERAVWPLLDTIDEQLGQSWLEPLAGHLRAVTPPASAGNPVPMRRLAVARHIAELFDHYALYRPDLVLSWLDDDPTEWQGRLWRLLRTRIAVPSPAESYRGAAGIVGTALEGMELPPRLSLFGLTRLPSGHLEVLEVLARHRDVHMFLLHPSGVAWERVAEHSSPADASRSADLSSEMVQNPLSRSWGRDAREMQLVLAARGIGGGRHYPISSHTGPATLLRCLQDDIRHDRCPSGNGPDRPLLLANDISVRIHACHGKARQVEVLRDAILHLLDDDPTLEPRDIIVMCPDIEAFAPLVHAAFAGSEGNDPPLRARLADRALDQTNPLLGVAARLLALAGSRVSAPQVMDLAATPPVSRRFRFDQAELSLLEQWVTETGIRWGIDAPGRRAWGLDRLAANTWRAGLDRILLGVAMSDDGGRLFGSTLPFGDMPSGSVDLAGRVAEFVDRLSAVLRDLDGPKPAGAWVGALVSGTELLSAAAPDDTWQYDELRRILTEIEAESAGQTTLLGREELESLLANRLGGRPTRANFRTGDLTVCTLVPMRSVPHRVVALLGLDDGAFPRHPESDGDDLLRVDPRIGERDGRLEDRQLLLDAVLAATDTVVITFSGRDERTNRPRPPCVPVAELLDAIDATVGLESGELARTQVMVQHPLQPFDPKNFTAGALATKGAWSYDRVYLAGAAAAREQRPSVEWLESPLPPIEEGVVQLDHLVQFVEHPVRSFLRRRLGLYLAQSGEEMGDAIPVELDQLDKWGLGDRLLSARLSGVGSEAAEAAERARGLLPPGLLADRVLDDVRQGVEQLLAVMAGLGFDRAPVDSVEVRVDLPDGRAVAGTIPNIGEGILLRCLYSRLGPKHRLAAWVRLLVLSAARPELRASAITVGRGPVRRPPYVSLLSGLDGPTASAHLATVVAMYDLGMREPLPLPCQTAASWAEGRARGDSRDDAFLEAERRWVGTDVVPGEDADPYHLYVWGRHRALASLLDDAPAPDEAGDGWATAGWAAGERTRFGRLAGRLWDPLLAHETLGAYQ